MLPSLCRFLCAVRAGNYISMVGGYTKVNSSFLPLQIPLYSSSSSPLSLVVASKTCLTPSSTRATANLRSFLN